MGLTDLADFALSQEPPVWTFRRPVLLPISFVPGQHNDFTFAKLSPPPFPRAYFGLCSNKSGDIYFYGGMTNGPDNELYHYSTRDNAITLLQCQGAGPGARQGLAMTLVGNVIAIHGGRKVGGQKGARFADPSLFLLNPVTREWSKIAARGNVPMERAGHAMATIGTTIYAFGGRGGSHGGCLNEVWAFDLNTLRTEPTWELIEGSSSQERPAPREDCTLVPYQNQLMLVGGRSGAEHFDDVWSLDPKTRRWTKLQCAGESFPARSAHAAVVLDDVMYVLGGIGANDSRPSNAFAFKISEQRWYMLNNTEKAPISRIHFAAVSVGTKIFSLGGDTAGREEEHSIQVLDTKYLVNPDLHTPERLKELDIQFPATLTLGELASWTKESRNGMQVQLQGLRNELQVKMQELRNELQIETHELRNELQVKVREMQRENLELERKLKEVDAELQREKMKVESKIKELSVIVGEVVIENSELEKRVKALEQDTRDRSKRSQIVTSVLESPSKRDRLTGLRGLDAQIMVDFLAEVLECQDLQSNADRRDILHLLSKLARSAQVFPKSVELSGVQCDLTDPINDGGGYGLIYKGVFKDQAVCVKAVRVFEFGTKEATKVSRAQAGELALLAHISHRNIIPLYGAYTSGEASTRICIVAPWMENGDLASYLKNVPKAPKIPLMCDLAAGLGFLHDMGILHADVKARNVLVSQSRHAMLTDFGVSTVLNSQVGSTTSRDLAGTIFWMAPERLIPGDDGEMSPATQQSDMWGFACVCFEALTGEIPFIQHYTPSQLIAAFTKRYATPLHPKRQSNPTVIDRGPLLTLAEKCWNYDPAQRPTAAEALLFLTELNVQDDRPSMNGELAMFAAAKGGRTEVKVDYTRLLSIV